MSCGTAPTLKLVFVSRLASSGSENGWGLRFCACDVGVALVDVVFLCACDVGVALVDVVFLFACDVGVVLVYVVCPCACDVSVALAVVVCL